MEIRISEKAKRQLRNIYIYFSENSISYAERFLNDFYRKIESLSEFPKMYEIVPQLKKHHIRKIRFRNYRILYQIDNHEKIIKIVSILHSKQRLNI